MVSNQPGIAVQRFDPLELDALAQALYVQLAVQGIALAGCCSSPHARVDAACG